ncbi:uncharacterized protein N7479_007871, partial [Penicillium vulpinum]|uniref:uncharacterized protein n=1 Tax=Penicillium vulpinum TaxID=29845 RepID=UPI00254682B9
LPLNFKLKTLEGIAIVERYWRKYSKYHERNCFSRIINTGDAFINTSSYSPVAASSILILEKFLVGVFLAERKIPRRTKDKNTLDIDTFGVIYRYHWVHDLASYFLKTPRRLIIHKRNILYTIIEFRNLKGRPEGADSDYQLALKELGRDTRFEDDIGYYNFRRWTKILLARSDKGYLGSLVTRCLKNITNHNLLRATFSISFFFDPPKKNPEILYKTVKKDIAKLRKTLAIKTRELARKDYFNNTPVLKVNRQIKQILLGESNIEERDTDSSAEED